MKKIIVWILTAVFILSMLPVGGLVNAKSDGISANSGTDLSNKPFSKTNTNRETLNFNREWKFLRGDTEDAESVDFDDSIWTDVGLPHNFSIPYNMETNFYVGYGWYRKKFDIPDNWMEKRVNIEFEGAFQVAEIFVNGEYVGKHEGGYTGFTFDITDYIVSGEENVFAVRVNNLWRADLSPRAGDHQFTGGINRDVSLTVTDDVHVSWYGTFVSTPDLTNPDFDKSAEYIDLDSYISDEEIRENIANKRSNVNVKTEVKNESTSDQMVQVKQEIVDKENLVVASFASEHRNIPSGELYNFDTTSEQIQNIEFWSPENPYVYKVYTTIYKNSIEVDRYESPLGFRWVQWKTEGLYLNGDKVHAFGSNVHEDHAGWSSAVTNEAAYRDVQMVKDAGMNLIRGSHYPHDPAFSEACDEIGMMFWSESVFWGAGGSSDDEADPTFISTIDWVRTTYPNGVENQKKFDAHCKQTLTEMIRVNRNHPSIVVWSMGNEVFFDEHVEQTKSLVNELRNLTHQLDPTRKAAMGGVQRKNFDTLEICDVAGYNGDGGSLYANDWMPNIVSEYGSKTADRPGEYRPYYHDIEKKGDIYDYTLRGTSAGLILWCAFDHGSVLGRGLARMGMIDYNRLPKKTWYWYRKENLGIEPEFSVEGKAKSMNLTASQYTIGNNGTDDAQITVAMLDENGKWVNDSQAVTLTVVDGPGVFPDGKSIEFTPNNTMRDGKAAISFRSYYSGKTTILASSAGLKDVILTIETEDRTGDETGTEPDGFMEVPEEDNTSKIPEPKTYGERNIAKDRPIIVSSNDTEKGKAADGDINTSWTAATTGSEEYLMQDFEANYSFYKLKLDFSKAAYPYKVETSYSTSGPWKTIVGYNKDTISQRPYEESLFGAQGRYIKISFIDVPEGEHAFLSELEAYGIQQNEETDPACVSESSYLSDMQELSLSNGWGTAGKDMTCENKPITINGMVYEKGLGFHANSEISYNLDGKYSRFQAVAGIDDETSGFGDAIYQIFATLPGEEEQLIYEKNITTGSSDYIDLSVSGVQTLRLVTDTNGAAGNDHTDWADAKLLGAIRDISKTDMPFKSTFSSNTMDLKSGEKLNVQATLKNQSDEILKEGTASLALYNDKGDLVDVVQTNMSYLGVGKSANVNLQLLLPDDITGYHARFNIYYTDKLIPIVKTTYIGAEISSGAESYRNNLSLSTKETSETWTKVDGEDSDIVKVGSWALWKDAKAYNGTETYVDIGFWENSTLSYTFTGSQVRIGAKVDGSQAGAKVYIDNEYIITLDTKATVSGYNAYEQVWESKILDFDKHTIRLEPTGKFGFDYFEYCGDKQEIIVVDKSALIARIEEANKFKKTDYTLLSWTVFEKALEAAIAVNKNVDAKQLDVDKAVEALDASINQLIAMPPVADMTKMKASLKAFFEFVESAEAFKYKDDSILQLSEVASVGYDLYKEQRVEQVLVNAKAQAILDALASLETDDLTVEEVAEGLTVSITEGQKQLVMPEVPEGFTVKLTASSNEVVIALDGTITPIEKAAAVDLTFTVSKGAQEATKVITVTVPKKLAILDLDTSLLEFMIAEADKQVEDGALVGVIEAVVERFNKALKEAKAVLVKADIDPTSVTQAEIDLATKNLIDALHMLDFKGTKGLLQNLVAKCEIYVADKALYSKATYDVFEAALEEAKTVLADKTAFQDEIDKAWFDLATGLAGLRKIPNKDALKGLLDKARSIDSSQYTVASFRVLVDAVDDANIVLGDTNASKEAVVSSEKAVKTAMDGLVPLVATTTDGTAAGGTSTTTKASDSDKVIKVADTTTKAATSVPKTGENSLVMLLFTLFSLSCVVTVVIRKKKAK